MTTVSGSARRRLAMLLTGVCVSSSALGCACEPPLPDGPDAFRAPRGDANDDAVAVMADRDALVVAADDANIDVNAPPGFDSGPGVALDCMHSHRLGEDFWFLGRDENSDPPSFTSVSGRDGRLIGVFSMSAADGSARRLRVFRYDLGGADRGGHDPVDLAGTDGGTLPSVAAGSDGYWVSFLVGTEIRVARFTGDLAPVGGPVAVGTDTVTVAPSIARTDGGGFVAWAAGNRVRGRALDAMGQPTGSLLDLATSATTVQQAAVQRLGRSDALGVAWADGTERPRVARLAGTSLGTAEFVAGDPGIFTSIDMGGQSMGTMLGLPLAGATVYDLNDLGFRDVIFRVIADGVVPMFPAATVSTGGDQAWSASVEPFLSGFALAYRARVPEFDSTLLRIGYLDREGCRLGSVTDRFVIGVIDSETGAVPQLAAQGGTLLIVWSDGRDGFYDYWASTLTCTERS